MLVNAIGHLSEIAWHHPDLIVSYARRAPPLKSEREVDYTSLLDGGIYGVPPPVQDKWDAASRKIADAKAIAKRNLMTKLHRDLTAQGGGAPGADHPRQLMRSTTP